jgi:hypothetical protein
MPVEEAAAAAGKEEEAIMATMTVMMEVLMEFLEVKNVERNVFS